MRTFFQSGLLAVSVSSFGCATRTPTAVEDSARAKYILVAALEAWKDGQVKSLSSRTPPIRFADDDQRAGLILVDYGFKNEEAGIKPFQDVPIVLLLRNRDGRTLTKTAAYQVAVDPVLTVLRSDN